MIYGIDAQIIVTIVATLFLFIPLLLRSGASSVFFDVVGTFQADRLLGDSDAKMATFNAIMLDGIGRIQEGAQALNDQFNMLIDSVMPMTEAIADARIEFEKFVQTGQDAEKLAADITEIGAQFGYAADQSLAAGARMAQLSSIIGEGAVTAATEVGIKFALIGGMQTETAMTRLINLQQQTKFMYGDIEKATFDAMSAEQQANIVRENSMEILNQLNTVENRSAATMENITFVMNQFAAQADMTGESIANMASMSAVLIEAGENQGKAGRALRIIYARLGANTSGAADALEAYGVSAKDAQGNMRPLSEVLRDLDAIWPSLTKGERQSLAQSVAGKNHYVRFLKIAENYNRMQELTTDALYDQDTAQGEVNKRLEENITKLREAEANLANYKAQLGEAFLPAIAAATQKQADFTEALADMANVDFLGLDQALSFMVTAQQYMQMFGPALDLFINLKQMTVAIETQHAITKSMMGIDLVRAGAYGGMQNMSRAMTGNLTQQQFLENAIAVTGAVREARYKNMSVATGARVIELKKIIVTQDEIINNKKLQIELNELLLAGEAVAAVNAEKILGLIQAKYGTMSGITAEQQEMLTIEMAGSVSRMANLHTEIALLEQKHATLGVGGQEALNSQIAMEGIAHAAITTNIQKEIADEAVAHRAKMVHIEKEQLGEVHQWSERLAHDASIKQLKAEGMTQDETHAANRRAIYAEHGVAGYNEITSLKARLAVEQDFVRNSAIWLFREEERSIALIEEHGNTQQVTAATNARKVALQQLNHVLMGTHTSEQLIAMLDATLINLKTKLNKILTEEGMAAITAAGGLNNLAGGADRAAVSAGTLTPRLAMNARAMNAFSMRAGMASMVLGMFSGNAKAAKASMALMMLSMLPMIYQAGQATMKLTTTTAALAAEAAAAETAAVATTSFSVALKSIGVGVALAVGAYALMELLDWAGIFDDATDSVDAYSNALTTLAVDSEKYASYAATSYEDLTLSIATLTSEIKDLEKAKKDASDSGARIINEELNTKKELRDMEEDILSLRQAQNIEGMVAAGLGEDTIQRFIDMQGRGSGMYEGAVGGGKWWQSGGMYSEGTWAGFQEEARTENIKLWDFIVKNGIDSLEEFYTVLGTMTDVARFEETGGAIGENWVAPINEATEALYEFNNAREELFYGMSSSNITGDLVRQVVREGVENLINTTEVIMTNQFMGMTTEEAADAIIQQIEEKSGLSGINLSMQ